jgi:type I restriction enzyme M protein
LSSTSDSLGRYYTAGSVGALLVSSLSEARPNIVLDLGAGDGALTSAAAKIWQDARYYTVDIDKRAESSTFQARFGPSFVHHTGDALRFDIDKRLGLQKSTADIAVCNPPYIRPKWRQSFATILEEAGLSGTYPTLGDVPADVLFIAQNLRFLKDNGRLGIIVPDGIVAGEHCASLRKVLSSSHSIQKIIELPRNIFAKTDAKAHIVVLSKGIDGPHEIEVQRLTPEGSLSKSIFIPRENASHRLDYTYLSQRKEKCKEKLVFVRDIAPFIKRGSISSAERSTLDYPVLHTSDIISVDWEIPKRLLIPKSKISAVKGVVAQAGDILLARVGRNLQEKVCMLKSGYMSVSDCIFVLRVPIQHRVSLFDYLRSKQGRSVLDSAARGVSARFLTTEAILEIPFGKKNGS